ncbi:thiol:disulfide interchange protein DsbG [Vreelandella alkaliphila]|uniref:Thiol:disulfide interchange protein n=1 Tax=Vreelandella alkaliphila TaxID=272774 RepID=A0A7C9P3A1_9GAMM|nr:thiol:disulfide interchange protein DsbG [Halomonas alkaliphila]NDL70450.1 thiol:disulfide interchange protein DsbG [Halomonas alkaliphila]
MHHFSLTRLSSLLLLTTIASAATSVADELPAPVQALANQGLTIHGQFETPAGIRGYGASVQGQDMAIYLTPDGEHAIVGTLMDSQGNDLTEAHLDEYVRVPLEAQTWQSLEESHWIQDGDADAPRVIYTFTDGNCPYCRQLWQQARPWVDAGDVQLRHIMVGILAPNSPALAATILGADDPASALHRHSEGESVEASAQPRDIEEQVYTNNQLFEELGLYATPTSAFQRETDDGHLRIDRIQGLPTEQRLIEMMGGEAP